jgi:hypothetical protein
VQTYFGDSVEESSTSHTSSMKGENSSTNGSDLDKNNIIKTTFDTLTDEGRKMLEAYRADLEELFYSRYEMTRQGGILKDAGSIILHKAEVAPEVRRNSPPSLNDIQSVINSALGRQANNSDELVRRFIEEHDRNKLTDPNTNPSSSSCMVSFSQTNRQTSGTSVGSATMPNPSAQSMNHFYNRTTIKGSATTFGMPHQTIAAYSSKGICRPHLAFLC